MAVARPIRLRVPLVPRRAVLSLAVIGLIIAGPADAVASDTGMSEPGPVPRPVVLDPLPDTADVLPRLELTASDGRRVSLGVAAVEALGLHRVRTSTFWPADDGVYEGPLLRAVLAAAGLDDAPAVRIAAFDGFSQVMPARDWREWPVILATRRDGRPLGLADKGPLRVIYPRDMDPGLADTLYRLRWVWMVRGIEPAAAP